ncbi:MAG: GDYXXLXY domain-containing protein [Coleofasciculaceae cyanobacterium]
MKTSLDLERDKQEEIPNNTCSSPVIWRFWIPLLLQVALIFSFPAQAIYTYLTGKIVILQTVPLDPNEILRGYSQRLRYDISSQDNLRSLPGWQNLPKQQLQDNTVNFIKPGTSFYVVMEAPAQNSSNQLPTPWSAVALSQEFPSQLTANQVALKGLAQNQSVRYGLETYYMPEDQMEQINNQLSTAKRSKENEEQKKPPIFMEIKVDTKGTSAPLSLWARVEENEQQKIYNYRF